MFLEDLLIAQNIHIPEELMRIGSIAGLIALGTIAVMIILVIVVGVYIYTSFAFLAIARKVKFKHPKIAWIPAVGPLLIMSKTAKMHWWPILLLIGMVVPFIGSVALLILAVYSVIWLWKTFEALKRPGWWAILCIIPVVNLIFIGIAAWSKK